MSGPAEGNVLADAPRRVAILGSTGSIGRQALEVAEAFPDLIRVVGLAAGGGRPDVFAEQARRFGPEVLALASAPAAREAEALTGRPVLGGPDGILAVATMAGADLVLNAMVGFAGAAPTLAAIRAGKDVALANKEPIVAAGHILVAEAASRGVLLLPVDSEPSAVFQLLAAARGNAACPGSRTRAPGAPAGPEAAPVPAAPAGPEAAPVPAAPAGPEAAPPPAPAAPPTLARIILTASGGPFYGRRPEELDTVTPAQALRHPTWRMGPKITIDSATLMNKGFEVIEASRLFGLPVDRIDVLVHRTSLVHSLVEFADGVILAHLGPPDMRYPIQFALTYPRRLPGPWPRLELGEASPLAFSRPDSGAFPCLRLAYEAGRIGKSLPAVLSAADEVLVAEFSNGRLGFSDIPRLLESVVAGHEPFAIETLEDAGMADEAGRRAAMAALSRLHGRRRTAPRGDTV